MNFNDDVKLGLKLFTGEIKPSPKYVGNINYRLSTIGNYYKAFLFPDFQSIIVSIERFLDGIKELFHVRFITYANHDPEHTKNVAKSLSQGLLDIHGENLFFRLNMIERYLLISSALLHDIGMALTDSAIKELDLERWSDIIKIDKDEIIRELEGSGSHIKKREKVSLQFKPQLTSQLCL